MKGLISEELWDKFDEETVENYIELAKKHGIEFNSEEEAKGQTHTMLCLFELLARGAEKKFFPEGSLRDSNT